LSKNDEKDGTPIFVAGMVMGIATTMAAMGIVGMIGSIVVAAPSSMNGVLFGGSLLATGIGLGLYAVGMVRSVGKTRDAASGIAG